MKSPLIHKSLRSAARHDTRPATAQHDAPTQSVGCHTFIDLMIQKQGALERLNTLVDTGAELSCISPQAAERCCPGSICTLKRGDTTEIMLADGQATVKTLGTVTVWIDFTGFTGIQTVQWRFTVVPISVQAIIGADFFASFGSKVDYASMRFHVTNSDPVGQPLLRRTDATHCKVVSVTTSCVGEEPRPLSRDRRCILVEDTWLNSESETVIEMRLDPPCRTPYIYEAVLAADEHMRYNYRGDGRGIADAVVKVAPGCNVYTRALNFSKAPYLLRKGTQVGYLHECEPGDVVEAVPVSVISSTSTEAFYDSTPDDDDFSDDTSKAFAQTPSWYQGNSLSQPEPPTRRSREEAKEDLDDPVRLNARRHDDFINRSDHQSAARHSSEDITEDTDDDVEPAQKHAPFVASMTGQEERSVTDEQLEDLLKVDGVYLPTLDGNDRFGRLKVDVARALLHKHRRVFAVDPKNPSVTNRGYFHFSTGDAKPICQPGRRFSAEEQKIINEKVEEMRARGQIKRSQSPWAANPVLVKQGGKIRFCLDYRDVNRVTKKDSHGLGNIDDMLQKLGGAQYFSSVDLAAGYYQVPLTEEAAERTAFRIPNGQLWQYTVAPFGLVNLPAAFTRLMHSVLDDALGVFALVYIDDVLSYSKTFDQHILDLDVVLQRLSDANLSCSLPKSQLFRDSVKYLGHIAGAKGIWPDPKKVKAMVDMAPPLRNGKLNLQLIQVMEGMFNYYRRYLRDYSTVIAPIAYLARGTAAEVAEKVWTKECEESFAQIKQLLLSQVVLAHPDPNLPFVIQTDASEIALGAVLTQFRPRVLDASVPQSTVTGSVKKKGKTLYDEVVIGFFSKLNSVNDSRMSQIELEALAAVAALVHFRPYIWGRPVTLVTDAASIKWMLSHKGTNGKVMRWSMRVQEFDVTIAHRSGRQNRNADALSRLPQQSELDQGPPASDADLQWPDAIYDHAAPPSGIRFEPSISFVGAYAIPPAVSYFNFRDACITCPVDSDVSPQTTRAIHSMLPVGTPRGNIITLAVCNPDLTYFEDVNLDREDLSFDVSAYRTSREDSLSGVDLAEDRYALLLKLLAISKEGIVEDTLGRRAAAVSMIADAAASTATATSLRVGVNLPTCTLGDDFGPLKVFATTTRQTTQANTAASRAAAITPPLQRNNPGKRKASRLHVPAPTSEQGEVPPVTPPATSLAGSARPESPGIMSSSTSRGPVRRSSAATGRETRDQPGPSPISLAPEPFMQHQQRDNHCSAFIDYISEGKLPDDDDLASTVIATHSEFSVTEEGMLIRFASVPSKGDNVFVQAVVPQTLRPLVLRLAHDDANAGHGGIAATHLRIANNYWWPTLATDVRTYVSSCLACQQRKPGHTTQVDQVVRKPARLWQNFSIDLLDTHKETKKGNKHICLIVERFTGYCWVFAISNKKEETVAACVFQVFLQGGAPEELQSDNGGEFVNMVLKHLCLLFQVHKIETSSYHPQANGKVERLNSRVLQILYNYTDVTNEWDEEPGVIAFAINTTPHSTTGLTPFYAMHCREALVPAEVHIALKDQPRELHESIMHRLDILKATHDAVDKADQRKRDSIDKRNERLVRKLNLKPNDYVWVLKQPVPGIPYKLDTHYTGPWQIIAPVNSRMDDDAPSVTFICKMKGRKIVMRRVHMSHMKIYHHRPGELDNPYNTPRVYTDDLQRLPLPQRHESIIDRMWDTEQLEWNYRTLLRDGRETEWINERRVLAAFSPSAIDTFHAIYELNHKLDMPRRARRRQPPPGRALTEAQAMLKFPRGTLIVRAGDLDAGEKKYYSGIIRGYKKPWWRGCYENGDWLDLTATEVTREMVLYRLLKERALDSIIDPLTGKFDDSEPWVDPLDLHKVVGRRLREHFSVTGWGNGVVLRVMRHKPIVLECLFEGDDGARDFRPSAERYCIEQNSPIGSWHLSGQLQPISSLRVNWR